MEPVANGLMKSVDVRAVDRAALPLQRNEMQQRQTIPRQLDVVSRGYATDNEQPVFVGCPHFRIVLMAAEEHDWAVLSETTKECVQHDPEFVPAVIDVPVSEHDEA